MRKKKRSIGSSTTLDPRPKSKSIPVTFKCSRCENIDRMPKPRFMPAAGIKCDKCGGQMAQVSTDGAIILMKTSTSIGMVSSIRGS